MSKKVKGLELSQHSQASGRPPDRRHRFCHSEENLELKGGERKRQKNGHTRR